jgi:hypothetical protein
MDALIGFFTDIQTFLVQLGPIVGVIGIACWFLMNALSGIIPEWGQAARGYLQKILLGAIVLGFGATLIGALIGMGGGGAGGA